MAFTFPTSAIEGVVSTLVEKLTNTAIEEVELLRGVRGEIEYIIDELEIMKAFLRSAEDQQDSNEVARIWVKQVRELAYDVEDCIDEFKLHLVRPDGHGLSSALQSCFLLLSTLGARHRIATQILNIKSRVKQASKRKSLYLRTMTTQGLTPSSHAVNSYAPHDPRMTALFVEEKDLVGMDKPKRKLIGWLTRNNQSQLGVISVVGMGGLGKTTLVKKVYESARALSPPFECHVWITVSKFHIMDLLKDMTRQLKISIEEHHLRYELLIEKLNDHLKDKKYLIVFDDIWTISTWKKIKPALPDSNNGSWVIVTTRIETVADTCASKVDRVYKPQSLSDQQSWDLFCRRVFKESRGSCPEDLEDLSKAILEKCEGLPLAIVNIAGLLGSKRNKTREEWQQLNNQLKDELETNPSLEVVKQILNFSYYDLPHSLRPCFLYLSKYQEDYEIKRREVVELWAAEGLASGTQNMSAEEVAEKYFDELINRSMIQPSKIRWDGKVKSCTVHDVMLEVMVSKSREQNLLVPFLAADEHETVPIMSQQKIRRLSTNTRIEITDLSHVRSITIFELSDKSLACPRPRLLRVLDLRDVEKLSRQQVKWIGELIHLKHLAIHFDWKKFALLPGSWENLRQLETLELASPEFLKRIILFEGLHLVWRVITNFQKLRHLRGQLAFLPKSGIGNLRSLQTLEFVQCGKWQGHVIRDLGKLTQLRCLSLANLPSRHMPLLSASLSKLNSCLRSLKLYAGDNVSFDCLERISSPPLQLRKLNLRGILEKLPSWVTSLEDLTKITLYGTKLVNDAMQVLQNIPNLIHLQLLYDSFVAKDLCFAQEGFSRLQILRLQQFSSVTFEERAMPKLARLILTDSQSEVAYFGIEHLVELKELNVNGRVIRV